MNFGPSVIVDDFTSSVTISGVVLSLKSADGLTTYATLDQAGNIILAGHLILANEINAPILVRNTTPYGLVASGEQGSLCLVAGASGPDIGTLWIKTSDPGSAVWSQVATFGSVGTVIHSVGPLTTNHIVIGNGTNDEQVALATIDPATGLFAFINSYAKTDPTVHYVGILTQSSDGAGPFSLLISQMGDASAAARTINLQTAEVGVSNSGIMALQAAGGTLTIAGKEIAPGSPAIGEGLVWDGSKFAPSAVGDVTHTGALTANHITIGNGTPDIKESLATLDPSTGLFALINSYGKTDATAHIIGLLTQSSDGSNPFVLYITQIGHASSAAARTLKFQTGEFGLSNSGVLALQPDGGTLTIGGSIIDLSTHTDGNLLTWDAGTGTAHLKPFALPSTGVTPGTYGDTQNVGQFTVDAEGRITSAANVVTRATVTHTTGPLTTNGLIGGGGGDDIKRIDLSGDVTTGGSGVTTLVKQGIVHVDVVTTALTLTTSYQDIAGITRTIDRGGTWTIRAYIQCNLQSGDIQIQIQCVTTLGTLPGTPGTVLNVNGPQTIIWEWTYGPGTIGDVVKIQAEKVSTGGASTVGFSSKMVTEWIHD